MRVTANHKYSKKKAKLVCQLAMCRQREGEKKRKRQLVEKLFVGTWNVRTLLDAEDGIRTERAQRRSALVAKELKALRLDVVALTEVRKEGTGQLEESMGGFTIFWKGLDEGIRNHGVGFAVRTKLLNRLVTQPIGVNERLMYFRYQSEHGKYVTFVCGYAPTMKATDVEREAFYEDLQHIIDAIDQRDVIMLMGDFNARVGTDFQVYGKCIGKHGVGKCNSNGELLLEFCSRNKLAITNTMFRHRVALKGTWQHPRSKHWHLIDFVITKQIDRSVVLDTRVMRSADCSSDHRLVRSRIQLTYEKKKHRYQRPLTAKKKKVNVESLKNPLMRERFQAAMDEKLSDVKLGDDTTIEENWSTFRDVVYETSLAQLGTKTRQGNDWFDENDEEIQKMVVAKRQAFTTMLAVDAKSKSANQVKVRYLKLKGELQRRVRQLKNEWWQRQAKDIQTMHDSHNIRGMFQGIKKLCGPVVKANQAVKDLNGKVLVNPEDILKRWTEHFHTLLNQFSEADEKVLENIPQRAVDESMADPPTLEDINKALTRLKNNKATGEDGIPAEVFKYGGDVIRNLLHQIVCQIWKEGQVPQQWIDAVIIKLFKKKDPMECGNYRGISLLAVAGKILSNIILSRIARRVEEVLPESQCGFRSKRGTADMIFAVRQLQEKCKEQKMDLYMVFIDLTKAYDTVNRVLLWKLLAKYGIPDRLIRIIRSMHEGMKAKLNLDVGTSEEIPINNGLRQGCVKAPVLFNLFFAAVMFEALHDLPRESGVGIRFKLDGELWNNRRLSGKSAREEFIKELCYADDCGLVAHTQEELQDFMARVSEACRKYGLTISFKKTEVMKQATGAESNSEKVKIELDGKVLAVVDRFTYLGSTVTTEDEMDKEISCRLKRAGVTFGNLWKRVWKPGGISKKTKIDVYKACILSVLTYGCQTWNVYVRHINRLEQFHARCLRKILGIRWQELIPRTKVLERAGLPHIDTLITKARLKWLGHVRRMPDHRYPKRILMSQLSKGKRPAHKPYQRWKDKVKLDLKKFGMNPDSWWHESGEKQRASWRKKIYEGANLMEQMILAKKKEKRRERKARDTTSIQILKRKDGSTATNERVFPKLSGLRRHQTQVHTKPQHNLDLVCPSCQSHFTTRSARTRHKCTTRGAKKAQKESNFTCPTCSRTFTTASGRTRHKKFCRGKD